MQYPQQQLRQQQHQQSSQSLHAQTTPIQQHHQQGPNLRSQDNNNNNNTNNSGFRNRSRMVGGGDSSTFSTTQTPYRDDPSTAPVHLESFTRGGYGPTNIENALDDEYKKKANKSLGGFGYQMKGMFQYCCLPVNNNTSEDDDGDDDGSTKFYRDDFNDLSWTCTIGTDDESGIWLNRSDPAGTIMCFMVWILLGYSTLTITLLAETGGIPYYLSYIYSILCCLALASHVKTTLTDPGAVPPSAVPTEEQRKAEKLSMCSQCQTFKPPMSHHCRICNRCISRMDHHCPWMNNCVGAANMKFFCLFLFYTWSCSAFSLLLMGWNYFFCAEDDCIFNVVLTQLVRLMTILGIGAFLFTSSMIMNVVYGIMTGVGTIDRLKKKATNTMHDSDELPVDLKDIFGIGPFIMWFFPTDPLFDDYDRVMGYSTPQRLLREQILREKQDAVGVKSGTPMDGSLHLNTTGVGGGGVGVGTNHFGVPYGGAGGTNGTLF